jgi:polyhydroxyalkanoate synthesis regulator phasin
MQDAMRAYLELALGVTEASRKRATKVIEDLVGRGGELVDKGGATAKQVQALAGDLIATSTANRDALAKLVRFEVDRALGAVGLATAEEVEQLTRRVRELERALGDAEARLASGGRGPAKKATAAKKAPGKKAPGKKAPAKKAPAKKAVAKKAVAKKAVKKATAGEG